MSEQPSSAVKTIYFIWLQKNLDKYKFISENAKALKAKISELSVNTGNDEELMRECYVQFCNMVAKNPYDVLLGLNSETCFDILTYDLDFFPIQNQYGVYVPIRFLRENNLPVNHSFEKEKKQAEARVEVIKSSHSNTIKSIEDEVNALMKKHSAKPYKLFLMLFFIALSIYFFLTRSDMMESFTWNNIIELLAPPLAFITLIILIRSMIEYKNSIRMKNARKKWHMCLSMSNYFSSLPLKIEECDKQLSKMMAGADNKIIETDLSTGRSFVDDVGKICGELKELAGKPKLVRNRVGFYSILFMLVVCGFFYFLRFDWFISGVNSLNSLFGAVPENYTYAGATPEASSAAPQITRQARVVAPEVEMLSDAGEGDAVAAYKTGDILIYSEDPTCIKIINGLNWYKFAGPDGKSGWIVQTSVAFEDENGIKIDSVSANSTLTDSKGFVYKADFACDGYFASCWQEGSKGAGIGKYILFGFKEETSVSKIIIINGNAKTEESYRKNNRLKKAKLVFSDKSEVEIDIADNYSVTGQIINLPSAVLTKEVYFYIEEVYDGSSFNDTCISEIAFSR